VRSLTALTVRRAMSVNRADTARIGSASPPGIGVRPNVGRLAGVIRDRARDQSGDSAEGKQESVKAPLATISF
ncbi:MAG TPA: hypothetical protein VKB78_10650, partial [Pirellulales bacterium]|nr:hypothetical protein [Pirellulales bacterium]